MLTLDPTLQAAQDGDSHQPIIDLVSASFTESIPFDGSSFEISQTAGMHTDMVSHSSGAIVIVVGNSSGITLLVTDANRTEWNSYSILSHGSVCYPAVCELDNGDLGIVFTDGVYDLYYMIVGIDGTVDTTKTLITAYSTWVSPPTVMQRLDGSFMIVHAYYDGTLLTYSLLSRTSSDFETWSATTSIIPSGLDNTMRMHNPDISYISTGQIMLMFDFVDDEEDGRELINCYYMTSDDDGSTWSAPVALTSYTAMTAVGQDPVIVDRADGSVIVGFVEVRPLLYMNGSTIGWVSYDEVTNLHFNPSTGKLYSTQAYTSYGGKFLGAITVIDVNTWSIDKVYTTTSTPAFNSYFAHSDFWYRQDLGEGKYVCGIPSELHS